MGYREFPAPPRLRALVECQWRSENIDEQVRVLPDGCMDLIAVGGRIVVAGPDTTANVARYHWPRTPAGPTEPCNANA